MVYLGRGNLRVFRENDTIEKIRVALKSTRHKVSRKVPVSLFLFGSLKEAFGKDSEILTLFKLLPQDLLSPEKELSIVKRHLSDEDFQKVINIYRKRELQYLSNKSTVDNLFEKINRIDDDLKTKHIFHRYSEKLRLIVNSDISAIPDLVFDLFPEKVVDYYNRFSIEEIKKYDYNYDRLSNRLVKDSFSLTLGELSDKIYSEFKVGDRLSKKEIKEKLTRVGKDSGIFNVIKATDLARWFEIKEVNVYFGKNRVKGFQILSKKSS